MPTPQSVSQLPASLVAILGSVATASRIERLIGKMIDLGTLGGSFSVANDINADGEVVGASTTASGATHAFLYRHGHLTDVGTLGGAGADAAAINDRGAVVGESLTSAGVPHGFLCNHGKMIRKPPTSKPAHC